MLLPFSQQLNGKPTYFPEKILLGLDKYIGIGDTDTYRKELLKRRKRHALDIVNYHSKIHSFREDKAGRWETGKLIHMVIDNRKKTTYRFAPVTPCTGTQTAQIKWFFSKKTQRFTVPMLLIDGREIKGKKLLLVAKNDGFESIADFFAYFSTDWTGKIIHWTGLRY